jgi:hypothetical protein
MKVLFGVLFYLGLTLWFGFSSPETPKPQADQSGQKAEPNQQKKTPLSAALKQGIILQGDFIHDFREEIVTIGTVILAFATGFLYCATRDLVIDAKNSSQLQLRAYLVARVATVGGETDNHSFK